MSEYVYIFRSISSIKKENVMDPGIGYTDNHTLASTIINKYGFMNSYKLEIYQSKNYINELRESHPDYELKAIIQRGPHGESHPCIGNKHITIRIVNVQVSVLQTLKNLYNDLHTFQYGFLTEVPNNSKELEYLVNEPNMDQFFYTQDVDTFCKSHIGMCYDFAMYQLFYLRRELNDLGVVVKNYMILCIQGVNVKRSHSMTILKYEDTYYWIEYSYSCCGGIYKASSAEALIDTCILNLDTTNEYIHEVYENDIIYRDHSVYANDYLHEIIRTADRIEMPKYIKYDIERIC